jgi:fermentation-respiration switch protein FrsA (DUF1100 family)
MIIGAVLAAAVVLYAVLVAVLYAAQRRMLYLPPETTRTAPAESGFAAAEEVVLDTPDAEKVIAWHVPPVGRRPVVVFFHGNGDVLARRVERFRQLTSDGTGLVALSYRGYGGSTGEPTEQGILYDAAAAYEFAIARYDAGRIALWGFPLGTGPAVAIAALRPVGKLILEAPYTSTADIAAEHFPFIPIRLLMKDQYHSDELIGKVRAPLLVMHGERDQAIAFRFGELLFALAPEPKHFVGFPRGHHEDLDAYGAVDVVRNFIADMR